MIIFISGASGFVGRELCRRLVAQGHELRCLVRPGAETRLIEDAEVTPLRGNLFSSAQLAELIRGADAVIHLVGIIREFPSRGITFEKLHHLATEAIVSATLAAGVKRYLHMSANGTRENATSSYHRTKWLAEQVVRQSTLDWTVFRPSLIYGPEDQFTNMLAGLLRKLPLVPVIGNGEYRLQPVPVEQVAESFARALGRDSTINKTYHCGGSECISYNRLLDLVGAAIGKKHVRKLFQPLSLMRPAISILQHFPAFPMTSTQLQMLIEGNCCDPLPWLTDLALDPAPIELNFLSDKKAPAV